MQTKTILTGRDEVVQLKISRRVQLSHDTFKLKLDLPGDTKLGMPIGKIRLLTTGYHVYLWGRDQEGKSFRRPFTPISHPGNLNELELLIKGYFPNELHPKGGKLSQFLYGLKEGDLLEISGPIGKCVYHGNKKFEFERQNKSAEIDNLCLIAGGSGITPFYQLLMEFEREASEKGKEEVPEVSLLFFNKTEDDILLKRELEDLKAKGVITNLKFYVDSTRNQDWEGGVGFASEDVIRTEFPDLKKDGHYLFYCGNPAMGESINNALERMKVDNFFKY